MVVFWCEGECVAKESPALQNFSHRFHTAVRDIICRGITWKALRPVWVRT